MVSLGGLARKIFGSSNDRRVRAPIGPASTQINALEAEIKALTDEELAAKTAEFRASSPTARRSTICSFRPLPWRARRPRVLGMRPFDVQLIGGMILHEARIAEMRTGEGKTLVATLPVYLNALAGKGVHVVTVNDYLASRDCALDGPDLQLPRPDHRRHRPRHLDDDQRREAYACDITYATNNELGFDYLRDNMKYRDAARWSSAATTTRSSTKWTRSSSTKRARR